MQDNVIIEALGKVDAGTVAIWIISILAILGGVSAFAIKVYKLVEAYREKRNKIDEKDKMLEDHEIAIKNLKSDNEQIKADVKAVNDKIDVISMMLVEMQKKSDASELAKAQDRLTQMHRYYTSPERHGEWNKVEANTFWSLFRDYEARGGNGYMHEFVEPDMRKLVVK